MKLPYIILIDDDVQVLRAIQRDIRNQYRDEYKIAATESATVKVDRDGEANGSNYQDLLVLEHQTSNVTLAELLNNHQITIG